MDMFVKRISMKIPDFCMSHWLLRIPLIVVFAQQGLDKLPVDAETAASFDLPYLVWWVVAYGELGAAVGLFFGGLFLTDKFSELVKEASDILTRFSGFTIGCIMTGVIWIAQPESLLDVILYDHFHVMLWVGGLYFTLRGNRT
jgi:putative oxidoreductase